MPKHMALALALALACALGQCHGFNFDVKSPLAFTIRESGESFGASVLLQADDTNTITPWIQIGEPTPRSASAVKLPGVVYRCPIGGKCAKVKFNTIPGNSRFEDFVGGAMVSQSSDWPSTVVVCGSRWHDALPFSGTYFFTGACNWMDAPKPSQYMNQNSNEWWTPLLDMNRILAEWRNPKVYNWPLGQAGFSAHFLPGGRGAKKPAVVLGAPGVENWRGTLLYCEQGPYLSSGARSLRVSGGISLDGPKCKVPLPPHEEFDYLGYQVTSGRFFANRETLVAASAPRAGNNEEVLHGMVRLYNVPLGDKLKAVTTLVGDELGAYFGASLAAGDFNGDGFDDLAIGAPLSSRSGLTDDGSVHQFLGSGIVRSLQRAVGAAGKLQSQGMGGRFGHAMVCPGDLDKDGFADLVVGAPHEDNGLGVVYVFNGGLSGLSPTPSQRIMAREFNALSKGFGISLSPAADIDRNMYADLAVGGYGAAMVLRAHPVLTLRTTLSSLIDRIPQNASTLTVKACILFNGRDLPDTINVVRTIDVSSEQNLAQLTDATGQQATTVITNIKLGKDNSCSDIEIQIKDGSKYEDTVLVQASSQLDTRAMDMNKPRHVNGESFANDKFCKTCPVSRRSIEPSALRLEFENECENQTCIADLRIFSHFLRDLNEVDTHVVGSRKQLNLVVGAENSGEPAYATRLVVNVPPLVALAKVPSSCEFDEANAELSCDLRDLTPMRKSSSVTVGLDMSAVLDVAAGPLEFVVTALTRSKQQMEDNRKNGSLKLVHDAQLTIYGKPIGRASYRYDGGNTSTQQVDFAHEYTIEKVGESPIDDAVVRVQFPFSVRQLAGEGDAVTFLYANEPEVLQDGQPLSCTSSEPYLNATTSSEGMDSEVRSEGIELEVREKRETAPFDGDLVTAGDASLLPANQTLFLSCDNPRVHCARIECVARPFREESTIRMVVRLQIDVSVLGDLLLGKSIVSLTTFGDITWSKSTEQNNGNATSLFIGAPEVEKVANWIIALSIAGGLLLFFFLVMGLIKAGFFQRKQKIEMEALIEQEAELEAIHRKSQMPQSLSNDDEDE